MIKKSVLILMLLIFGFACPCPGAQAKKDPSNIRDSKLYKKWDLCHQQVCSFMSQKQYAQAIKQSEPLIGYLKEMKLTKSREMFETCNNLGAIHLHLKSFQPAHNYLWLSMDIGVKMFGADSLEVGFVCQNLSQLYMAKAAHIFSIHKDELSRRDNSKKPTPVNTTEKKAK